MKFPPPQWLLEMPEGYAKERAKERFLLRLACIYFSQSGHIRTLAEAIGMNHRTLKSEFNDKRITRVPVATYVRIEKALGPNFISKISARKNG